MGRPAGWLGLRRLLRTLVECVWPIYLSLTRANRVFSSTWQRRVRRATAKTSSCPLPHNTQDQETRYNQPLLRHLHLFSLPIPTQHQHLLLPTPTRHTSLSVSLPRRVHAFRHQLPVRLSTSSVPYPST
ncbi:hypothetical protein FA13DRAFT_329239 [Coprinellus micaceus]|uniref:Uncharacterized protein n=1 Tax=Coprinellus micaceus TaxID=71717 RepID=A0A4Y7SDQ0_COPMI|nr:hypothetical protein FA13DRAFT_329239 [Coprinellus micaceus]